MIGETNSGNTFVLVLVGGLLFLVLALPALWSRLRRAPGPSAPTYRTALPRATSARLGHSQPVSCLHCPATCRTLIELDLHMKFDCVGLGRKKHDS